MKNDVTGDNLHSGATSDAYRSNFDAIFGKKGFVGESDAGIDIDLRKGDTAMADAFMGIFGFKRKEAEAQLIETLILSNEDLFGDGDVE